MPIQQMMLGVGKGIPQTNFSFASEVTDIEGSGISYSQNPKVTADPHNENRYAISFTDDDGSKDGFIRIATRSGNTFTLSPRYDAADGSNVGANSILFDPSNSGKIIFLYNTSKPYARVISFSGSSGSESFSRSSAFLVSNIGYSATAEMVPMGSTGRYVIPLLKNGVCYLRIITASSTDVTSRDSSGGSDAISLTTTSSTSPDIVVDPTDSTKGMMMTVNTSEKLVARALTFSGSGTSANVSIGAETQLTPNQNSGGGYSQNVWHSLVACGSGKYVAFAKGGDPPHRNKLTGVAFDYDGSSYTLGSPSYGPTNITTSTAGEWSASHDYYSANNIISLVGNYGTVGGYRPLYGIVCTRSDDRTLSYTNAHAIANGSNTKLFRQETAQGYDDANTNLSVISNNANGSNFDNLSAVLWQAGGS